MAGMDRARVAMMTLAVVLGACTVEVAPAMDDGAAIDAEAAVVKAGSRYSAPDRPAVLPGSRSGSRMRAVP